VIEGSSLPTTHLIEMHLTHAPHHVKMRLDKIFPALTCMDIFLLDFQGLTNGKQLPGAKDSAIVRDETLGRTKLLYSRIQDNQNAGQILTLKDVAGENSSREGIHDRDDIKGPFDLRNAMLFDVADIYAPPLMTKPL
jgi:hypothetical protein